MVFDSSNREDVVAVITMLLVTKENREMNKCRPIISFIKPARLTLCDNWFASASLANPYCQST